MRAGQLVAILLVIHSCLPTVLAEAETTLIFEVHLVDSEAGVPILVLEEHVTVPQDEVMELAVSLPLEGLLERAEEFLNRRLVLGDDPNEHQVIEKLGTIQWSCSVPFYPEPSPIVVGSIRAATDDEVGLLIRDGERLCLAYYDWVSQYAKNIPVVRIAMPQTTLESCLQGGAQKLDSGQSVRILFLQPIHEPAEMYLIETFVRRQLD